MWDISIEKEKSRLRRQIEYLFVLMILLMALVFGAPIIWQTITSDQQISQDYSSTDHN